MVLGLYLYNLGLAEDIRNYFGREIVSGGYDSIYHSSIFTMRQKSRELAPA